MVTASPETFESRPYKIFISLLDKWEIGLPLTEVLILDALKAIKQSVGDQEDGSANDVRCLTFSLCVSELAPISRF